MGSKRGFRERDRILIAANFARWGRRKEGRTEIYGHSTKRGANTKCSVVAPLSKKIYWRR